MTEPEHDPEQWIFAQLATPFEPHEVKEREGDRGRFFKYIEDTTAMRRLDQVLGPANWDCDVTPCEGGVKCAITITLPTGRKVTRASLGGYAKMPSPEDSFKSGDTDAFKRAAMRFGIATYLPTDDHAPSSGRPSQAPPRGQGQGWPGGYKPQPETQPDGRPTRFGEPGVRTGGQPRNGKGLWARLLDVQRTHRNGRGLVDHIIAWGKQHELPAKMAEWHFDWVKSAEVEARAYLEGELAHEETLAN